jgi:hypothetical protein
MYDKTFKFMSILSPSKSYDTFGWLSDYFKTPRKLPTLVASNDIWHVVVAYFTVSHRLLREASEEKTKKTSVRSDGIPQGFEPDTFRIRVRRDTVELTCSVVNANDKELAPV